MERFTILRNDILSVATVRSKRAFLKANYRLNTTTTIVVDLQQYIISITDLQISFWLAPFVTRQVPGAKTAMVEGDEKGEVFDSEGLCE